ncbi:MAG: polyisoprenyl-phosphate glycosyltransferase [Patescibacteria group bacterium]|nr:polyisoprenyl-phosphate glycosyltransferase [Patescibacteria group bacterium]
MSQPKPIKKLSIIVPVYNEAEGVRQFHKMLVAEVAKLQLQSHEIIFVNDGSSDNSAAVLDKLAQQGAPETRAIHLTRNFGKEAALSAGLHNASGDAAIMLDSDGQHPPSMMGEFMAAYKEGYDMVVGVRTDNLDEKKVKKLGNKLYYRLLKMVGVSHLQPRVTDFRLLSREVMDEFSRFSERRRITRGLLDWMGFNVTYIEFKSPSRLAGTATYDTKKLMYLAVDSILSNSRKPLAISLALGSLISLLSTVGFVFIATEVYLLDDPLGLKLTGSALLFMVTLFMIGIILVAQGIASLYLARIYEETQKRPLYIIDRVRSTKL